MPVPLPENNDPTIFQELVKYFTAPVIGVFIYLWKKRKQVFDWVRDWLFWRYRQEQEEKRRQEEDRLRDIERAKLAADLQKTSSELKEYTKMLHDIMENDQQTEKRISALEKSVQDLQDLSARKKEVFEKIEQLSGRCQELAERVAFLEGATQ